MRRRVFSGIRLGKIGARAGGVWARQGYLPTPGEQISLFRGTDTSRALGRENETQTKTERQNKRVGRTK